MPTPDTAGHPPSDPPLPRAGEGENGRAGSPSPPQRGHPGGQGEGPSRQGEVAAAWQRLLASPTPLKLDVPVLLRKLPEHSRPNRLVLEVLDERHRRLGSAAVFHGGWYPGRPAGTDDRVTHYFAVLGAALAGLELRGEEP